MNESLRQIDDPSRQEFSVQYLKLPATEHNLPDEPWVLDIDLDYFSCSGDPYLQHDIKLELTQREYHALQSPYHPFNLLKGRPKLITANGCFFAQFTQSDPEYSSCMTVSEDEIIRRVDNLVDFLNEQDIDPMFVIVCRSRHSGFTRADQWEFIECTLLERLNEAFEFDPAPFSKVGRPRCRALLGG